MKFTRTKLKNSKLIKLKLLTAKIYLYKSNKFGPFNVEEVELHIKKILQIIYNFHINRFSIFFIGVPLSIQQILKKTNHMVLPQNSWVDGILANKSSIFKYLKKKFQKQIKENENVNVLSLLLSVRKKPSLVVVFGKGLNKSLIKEVVKLKIPIIVFESEYDKNVFDTIPDKFLIPLNKINNILFFMLRSIVLKNGFKK